MGGWVEGEDKRQGWSKRKGMAEAGMSDWEKGMGGKDDGIGVRGGTGGCKGGNEQ